MKYVVGALIIAGTLVVTYVAMPRQIIDDCCEYIGLLGPEDVSEVPGVDHAQIEAARDDGAIPATVPGLKLYEVMKPFELPDIHGKQVSVDPAQSRFTAITWVSSLCPTSMVYEVRLNELKRDYPGVNFVAINSSAMESVSELRDHFGRNDPDALNWNILKDDRNVIADRVGARVSTETFVFDAQGRLQYRGAIDDARNPQRVEVKYLRTVLDALLAGGEPKWRYQPPKGCCPIDRVKLDSPEKATH